MQSFALDIASDLDIDGGTGGSYAENSFGLEQ
jgi:hypothetical protein